MKSIFDEVINNEYSNVVDRFIELDIFRAIHMLYLFKCLYDMVFSHDD